MRVATEPVGRHTFILDVDSFCKDTSPALQRMRHPGLGRGCSHPVVGSMRRFLRAMPGRLPIM
jgi:hypothetical protein